MFMGSREAVDAAILRALSDGPKHGFAISEAVGWGTEERDIYLALHRLELSGTLASRWGSGENRQRAKYYALRESRGCRPELAAELLALLMMSGSAAAHPGDAVGC